MDYFSKQMEWFLKKFVSIRFCYFCIGIDSSTERKGWVPFIYYFVSSTSVITPRCLWRMTVFLFHGVSRTRSKKKVNNMKRNFFYSRNYWRETIVSVSGTDGYLCVFPSELLTGFFNDWTKKVIDGVVIDGGFLSHIKKVLINETLTTKLKIRNYWLKLLIIKNFWDSVRIIIS